MHKKMPAGEVTRRLESAANRMGRDAQKTKVLAAALCGFAKPVPDYEPLREHLLRPGEGGRGEDVSRGLTFRRDFLRDL
jgi:hypothetical protein